jgi:hypothetical protein
VQHRGRKLVKWTSAAHSEVSTMASSLKAEGLMIGELDFEFDVAFSFHSLDEGLAIQVNDLLQDQFKTFIYSERQAMLAGTDGEETFNAVYGRKARCVVVLYRKEWGETPFTRIEQTAIRNRAFQEGYEFTLFVPSEKPPSVPTWLPKTRLWLDWNGTG